MKLRYLSAVILSILFFVVGVTRAFALTGTIDPTNLGYKFAKLVGGPNAGMQINSGNFQVQPSYNATVTDTSLLGYMWGSTLGWINLNCANNSTCGTVNYKVSVDSTTCGVPATLSGYAWSTLGWVNFGPFSINTPVVQAPQVTINTSGEWNGYAWASGAGGGWIEWDCSSGGKAAGKCTVTDWHPPVCSSTTTTTTTGGGSTGGVFIPPTTTTTGGTSGTPTTTTTTGTSGTPTTTTTTGTGTSGTTATTGTSTSGTPTTTTTTGTSGTSGTVSGTTAGTSGTPTTTTGTSGTTTTSSTGPTTSGTVTGSSGSSSSSVSSSTTGGFTLPSIPAAAAPIVPVATATGLIVGVVTTLTNLVAVNPLVAKDLVTLPFRLWTGFLWIVGIRRKPWGIVYDAKTKRPLDPVYVTLYSHIHEELESVITDMEGRYGFKVRKGTYYVVPKKTHYIFPSVLMRGRDSDDVYDSLYFGDPIVVENDNQLITKNIPMDPIAEDWNEQEKVRMGAAKRHASHIFGKVLNLLFWVGFALTAYNVFLHPIKWNIIMFAIYIVLFIISELGLPPKTSMGAVFERLTETPIASALVRIYSATTGVEVGRKVTDEDGYYYALVKDGVYQVTVQKQQPDGNHGPVIHKSEPIQVKKGVLSHKIEI
jgi:hypothetical protein